MSKLFGSDYEGRKAIPIFEGVLMYFPKALAAVAEVSAAGNKQHNPGQPLHWARGKSTDQFNTALRHMMDHRMGGGRIPPEQEGQEINNGWRPEPMDEEGVRHLAKAAWRVLAALELAIEEDEARPCQPGLMTSAAYRDEYPIICTHPKCPGHKLDRGVCQPTNGVIHNVDWVLTDKKYRCV